MDTASEMCISAPAQDTAHSFGAELTPAATAYMSAAAPSLTSVPARMQDANPAYLPSPDSGLMQPPPLKSLSFPNNTLRSGLVRSHSVHAMPCPASTRMLARPTKHGQDAFATAGTSRASSAPGLVATQQGMYQAKPPGYTVLSGNASNPFSSGNRGLQVPASESAARELLMREVNKVEQGFNPEHAHWLAGQTAHIGVQPGTSALVQPEKKHPVMGVYDLMDRQVEWRVHHAAQQQQHRRPVANLMPGASQDHNALLIPALDCGQQLHMASFKQTPLQPRNEHAIVHNDVHNDYSPY